MKRKIVIVISTVGGLTVLGLIFYLAGIQNVFFEIGQIGLWGAVVFIANALFILFLATLSWQIILASYGYRLTFRDVFAARVIGFAVSYLTPSMYIGGEPLRAYMISKRHRLPITRVGATVIVDKFLELGAGLFFIYLGSIWTLIEYSLPRQIYLTLFIVNILLGAGMGMLLVNFLYESKLFTSLATLLERINPLSKIIKKIKPEISKLEDHVFLAFNQHRTTTLLAFCIKLCAGLLIFIKPAIFFYFLKTVFKLSELALLFALTHLILALQFTPGALGIFELGEVGIFKLVGIEPNRALAFSLMVRITDFLGVGIALFLVFHLGWKGFWEKRGE
jgi:uncharacterized protein (TIRG00374 family)